VVGNLSPPTGYNDYGLGAAYGDLAGGGVLDNIFVIGCSSTTSANFVDIVGTSDNTGGLSYMDHNDYYVAGGCKPGWLATSTVDSLSAWTALNGFDAHSVTSDPALASITTDTTCSWTPSCGSGPQPCPSWAKLTKGSPMEGTGADPTASPYNQPAIADDYYGAAVPAVSCGSGYNLGADNSCP
jgi:hypothetical protein